MAQLGSCDEATGSAYRREDPPLPPPGWALKGLQAPCPPPVHLVQLQPLTGLQRCQLSLDLSVLLLRGCQLLGKLLADHLCQVTSLGSQPLAHLGAGPGESAQGW